MDENELSSVLMTVTPESPLQVWLRLDEYLNEKLTFHHLHSGLDHHSVGIEHIHEEHEMEEQLLILNRF